MVPLSSQNTLYQRRKIALLFKQKKKKKIYERYCLKREQDFRKLGVISSAS